MTTDRNETYNTNRMKKYLTLLLICMFCLAELAAQGDITPGEISRTSGRQKDFSEKNSVYAGMSLGSFHSLTATFGVEYQRQWKNNLYWSVGYSQSGSHDGLSPDETGVRYNMTNSFLTGLVHYRVPLIKNRLFFCGAAGISAGYHHMSQATLKNTDLSHKFLPYFTFDLYWLYRTKWGGEIKVGPFITTLLLNMRGGLWRALPSRISHSPWDIHNDIGLWTTTFEDYVHVSLGYRF